MKELKEAFGQMISALIISTASVYILYPIFSVHELNMFQAFVGGLVLTTLYAIVRAIILLSE